MVYTAMTHDLHMHLGSTWLCLNLLSSLPCFFPVDYYVHVVLLSKLCTFLEISNPLEIQLTWDLLSFSCSWEMVTESNICPNDSSSSSLNLAKRPLVKRIVRDKTQFIQKLMESVFSWKVRPVDLRGIFMLDGILTTGPESLLLLSRPYPHM